MNPRRELIEDILVGLAIAGLIVLLVIFGTGRPRRSSIRPSSTPTSRREPVGQSEVRTTGRAATLVRTGQPRRSEGACAG